MVIHLLLNMKIRSSYSLGTDIFLGLQNFLATNIGDEKYASYEIWTLNLWAKITFYGFEKS